MSPQQPQIDIFADLDELEAEFGSKPAPETKPEPPADVRAPESAAPVTAQPTIEQRKQEILKAIWTDNMEIRKVAQRMDISENPPRGDFDYWKIAFTFHDPNIGTRAVFYLGIERNNPAFVVLEDSNFQQIATAQKDTYLLTITLLGELNRIANEAKSSGAPAAAPLTPEQEAQRYTEFVRQTMPEADPEIALTTFREMSPEDRRIILEGFEGPAAPASTPSGSNPFAPAAPKTPNEIYQEAVARLDGFTMITPDSNTEIVVALINKRYRTDTCAYFCISQEKNIIGSLVIQKNRPDEIIVFSDRESINRFDIGDFQHLPDALIRLAKLYNARNPSIAPAAPAAAAAPGVAPPESPVEAALAAPALVTPPAGLPPAPPAAPALPKTPNEIYQEAVARLDGLTIPPDFRTSINHALSNASADSSYFYVDQGMDVIGFLRIRKTQPDVIDVHTGITLAPIATVDFQHLSDALIELAKHSGLQAPPVAPPAAPKTPDEIYQEAIARLDGLTIPPDFRISINHTLSNANADSTFFYVDRDRGGMAIGTLRIRKNQPDVIDVHTTGTNLAPLATVDFQHLPDALIELAKHSGLQAPPVAPPAVPSAAPPAAPPSNPAAPTTPTNVPSTIEAIRNMLLRDPITASLFAGAMAITIISGIYAVNSLPSSPSDSQKPPKKTESGKISEDTKKEVLDCIFTILQQGPQLDHCVNASGSRVKGAKITSHKCTDGPDKNDRPDKCDITITQERRKGTATAKMTQPGQRYGAKLPLRVTVRGK